MRLSTGHSPARSNDAALVAMKSTMGKRKEKESLSIPPVPEGWTKCQYYLIGKHRFCHQTIVSSDHKFCGHHWSENQSRRIPCPADPTHYVLESRLESHLRKCPKAKRRKFLESQPYYQENINSGGHGELGQAQNGTIMVERAKQLALAILRIYCRLFGVEKSAYTVTEGDIINAIPMEDLSEQEYNQGFQNALETYRIKPGGASHSHQLASLLGHVRNMDGFRKEDTSNQQTILEVGAGRGILGVLVSSVSAVDRPTELIMVEKDVSRDKGARHLRNAEQYRPEKLQYMNPCEVKWSTIEADLSHVQMAKVCEESTNILVVAKHLCGAGSDLALKSLEEIMPRVQCCLMATCCHGLCTWSEFVGRNFLLNEMQKENISFGADDFELFRKWACATVSEIRTKCCSDEDHADFNFNQDGSYIKLPSVIDTQSFQCGYAGFGRACQRLIDYGRKQYIESVLCKNNPSIKVDILHYVDPSITPQNAILRMHIVRNESG